MSKAILVMDMPKNCGECPFNSLHPDIDKIWCCGLIAMLKDRIECVDKYDFFKNNRPDLCPLRPMPEKKKELNLNDILKVVESKEEIFDGIFLSYMIDGYNACIDEIGGNNETDKETHQST